MKVIFLEDVSGVARAGQTREVANGYARNYLLPRKLAVQATSQASTQLEAQLKRIAQRQAIEEAEMAEVAGKLEGTEITIKAKVGEKERLYGSVTAAEIARVLTGEIGREIDKRKIELSEPIRQLGTYDVTVKFLHDIAAGIKVTVLSDAEPEAGEEPAAEVVAAEAEEKTGEEAEDTKAEDEEPPAEDEEPPAETEEPVAEIEEPKAEEVEEPVAEEMVEEEKPEEVEDKEKESGE